MDYIGLVWTKTEFTRQFLVQIHGSKFLQNLFSFKDKTLPLCIQFLSTLQLRHWNVGYTCWWYDIWMPLPCTSIYPSTYAF